jgi:hypothetical protein
MRQHGEHCSALRTLNAPDGDSTQTDTDVVGVARQTPAPTTDGLVCELKATGQEKGEDTLDKHRTIVKELKVGRFILKINSNGPVFSCPFGCFAHVSPPAQMVFAADGTP